jgi:hypothetical protein
MQIATSQPGGEVNATPGGGDDLEAHHADLNRAAASRGCCEVCQVSNTSQTCL